jgi:carbamoyl-phosphate synthase large subunit
VEPIRALVTGAGSGVGQGIVKALRVGSLPVSIVSSDIGPLNAALFRADESLLLPRVEDDGALEQIIAAISKHDIDVVMVGSEFDLEFFSRNRQEIEDRTGALVVASPVETVSIADDKWLTTEFLRSSGLPYAESHVPRSLDEAVAKGRDWGYPFVIKTRRGTSSRHVHILHAETELEGLFGSVPMPMLQRLINRPTKDLNAEFTCSVFKCSDGSIVGPFTARRTLRGGTSWLVEVDRFEFLFPLLLSIGRLLPIMGSFNVQLMLGEAGPVPFEFNSRFSGTTAVRAHFGFNEPEMVLRSYLLHQQIDQPVIRRGIALRYLEEVFVEGVMAKELHEPLPKGEVRPWF